MATRSPGNPPTGDKTSTDPPASADPTSDASSADETSAPPTSADSPPTSTSEPPPDSSTSEAPPSSTSEPPPSTSEPPPDTTTSEPPPDTTTSEAPPTTTSEEPPTTTSEEPTSSEKSTRIITSTQKDKTRTSVVIITTTADSPPQDQPTSTSDTTVDPTPVDPNGGGGGSGHLDSGAKIAIGVAVPIGAIAILAIVGLFFWKKRKARKNAAEERRKEVEDYSYNPNADPTIPNVGGMGASEGGYEMREDGSGYRGWGTTTVAGSAGRKASTTMSGGGLAYSDPASPTQGHASVSRDGDYSPEGEILGAMGPAAANNRGTGVNRGPSNASSSYSAGQHSENSDGVQYGGGTGSANGYYDGQGANAYSDNPYAGANAQELSGQPVIRDNPARRNTRIENPAHYPQQSAGISQNF